MRYLSSGGWKNSPDIGLPSSGHCTEQKKEIAGCAISAAGVGRPHPRREPGPHAGSGVGRTHPRREPGPHAGSGVGRTPRRREPGLHAGSGDRKSSPAASLYRAQAETREKIAELERAVTESIGQIQTAQATEAGAAELHADLVEKMHELAVARAQQPQSEAEEEHQAQDAREVRQLPRDAQTQRRWKSKRRIDPDDGIAYAWEELFVFYKGRYKKKEVEAYWETCRPLKSKRGRKAKAKTKMKSGARRLQSNGGWRRPLAGGAASL